MASFRGTLTAVISLFSVCVSVASTNSFAQVRQQEQDQNGSNLKKPKYVPGMYINEECFTDKQVTGDLAKDSNLQRSDGKYINLHCDQQWALRYQNTIYQIYLLYQKKIKEMVEFGASNDGSLTGYRSGTTGPLVAGVQGLLINQLSRGPEENANNYEGLKKRINRSYFDTLVQVRELVLKNNTARAALLSSSSRRSESLKFVKNPGDVDESQRPKYSVLHEYYLAVQDKNGMQDLSAAQILEKSQDVAQVAKDKEAKRSVYDRDTLAVMDVVKNQFDVAMSQVKQIDDPYLVKLLDTTSIENETDDSGQRKTDQKLKKKLEDTLGKNENGKKLNTEYAKDQQQMKEDIKLIEQYLANPKKNPNQQPLNLRGIEFYAFREIINSINEEAKKRKQPLDRPSQDAIFLEDPAVTNVKKRPPSTGSGPSNTPTQTESQDKDKPKTIDQELFQINPADMY
ncbi:MAG: hypothetical protein AB7F43_14370 [Bacteriovoracia bacterium]